MEGAAADHGTGRAKDAVDTLGYVNLSSGRAAGRTDNTTDAIVDMCKHPDALLEGFDCIVLGSCGRRSGPKLATTCITVDSGPTRRILEHLE